MNQETTGLGPPYGPVANLKSVFDTWRDRSMPEHIDKDWLERIGISPHLAAKNMHALRFLGLIDEDGYTTPVAARLRVASSEDYPSVLEEIIRKAYRFVFEVRDPAQDARNRIEDVFRKEMPQAQRPRMVALFLGLCQLALMPLKEAPPIRAPREGKQAPRRQRVSSTGDQPGKDATLSPAHVTGITGYARIGLGPQSGYATTFVTNPLHPILGKLIDTLPQIENADELDNWYGVFRSAFTLVTNLHAKTKGGVES